MDADDAAVKEVESWAKSAASNVTGVQGDCTRELELPPPDGVLFANALHFLKDQAATLTRFVKMINPCGRVVLVEYDKRSADRWLPVPDRHRIARRARESRGTG